MNFEGMIVGLASFLIIGLFHPIVIKGEYHFTAAIWPLFLITGIGLSALSLFIGNTVFSSIAGVAAFTCLWSIPELFHQKKRVEKGWFPENPKRKSNKMN